MSYCKEKMQKRYSACINAEKMRKISGTPEYQYLEALNRNIAEYNANRGPNDPRRMPRHSYWEFSEEIRGRSTGGGLDWFLYRKEILHDIRHVETSCISYWNPAHGPPKRTDPCAQTSKIRDRIFQLIPLRPRR